jgi:hypothetical protein
MATPDQELTEKPGREPGFPFLSGRGAAASPFAELSMIPALTLVAINAPAGRRATWFALMASLMNVALVAGQLQTKYLNYLFEVGRGSYANLPELTLAAVALGFIVPLAGILAFGKRAI